VDQSELPAVISSTTIYDGRLFKLQIEDLAMISGVTARREMVVHPGAVAMLAFDAEERLLMVTQYRHGARQRLLELPAGGLEPGEDPRQCAVRELQEEVGMKPASVEPFGGFFVAGSYTTEYIHFFICRDLAPSTLDGDDDEDIEVVALSLEEALSKIDSGEISDSKTIIGVLRWQRAIHRPNG
jgi:ADP-ribose pyrophosphatase